ncbi:inactive beta-amylase 9-like, partial [Trifolium medium]|nr:inactive beta-amylase 9-like [Trifolium medium]
MESTITGISMGLGPDGELRYPSHHELPSNRKIQGVGEFQCYDQNLLSSLKQHAESSGNPLWGLGGPHDVPTYDQSPYTSSFFKDGGSWE